MRTERTQRDSGRRSLWLSAVLASVTLALAPFALAESEPDKADAVLPLPKWIIIDGNSAETVPLPALGGGLWPDDFNPDEVVHPPLVGAGSDSVGTPLPGEQDLLLRFLPRSLFGANRLLEPAPADQPLTEMPAEAWRACENASGSTRLLDPQGLLSETQGEDLTRLLAFHSEQAGVSAWILLVDSRQKLPSDADLSKLASGELARSTTCLAVYSFGAPARTRLFLTQSVSQAAAPGYLESLLNGCVREASLSPDPVEQLQRFATQLSIRLFWLERAYPVLKPKVVETPHAMETPESLSEVISIESSVAPPSKFLVFWRSAKYYISAAGGLLVLFVLILIAFARWRKRRNRMKVWRLPDFDHHHETRFGGPHCGGCGASIHFG